MDHNLEDSLTMESIENEYTPMDFDHSRVVVNQEDITLEDSSPGAHISMDLETIEEQPTMLDAGSEEVIVSDFIGDQFGFQDYCMQGDNPSGANITIDTNQLVETTTTPNEQMIDLQYADGGASKAGTPQSNIITIKAVPQHRGAKKSPNTGVTSALPRQVAIAPKPIKGAPNVQYAIAPKPVALMVNKNANWTKTIPIRNVVQNMKGNTVLAQIGKQLVMVPAAAAPGQKIKLANLPSGSTDSGNQQIQFVRYNADSAQLIANKGGKPVRTKFIVQGQNNVDPSDQPAVITKLMPVSAANQRYVMQQKTVPISIGGNKVVLTTPPKPGIKVAPKKQIISIKPQSQKVVTSQGNVQTKRVVISANQPQAQNVILKTTGVKTGAQVVKDSSVVTQQRTQLHPINVPGKGIQFIKLVTNQPAAVQKPAPKPQPLSMAGKNFVLTDSKGNIIQMTAEKVVNSQTPPILVSTTASTAKVTTKPTTKKLVRIAPISNKTSTTSAAYQPRPSNSLLIDSKNSILSSTSVSIEEFNEMVDQNNLSAFGPLSGQATIEQPVEQESFVEEQSKDTEQSMDIDVKPTLASLISDAVDDEEIHDMVHMEEVEIEYNSNTPHKQERYMDEESTNSMEDDPSNGRPDESLIIVPPNVNDNSRVEDDYRDDSNTSMNDSRRKSHNVNIESEEMAYLTPHMDQSYNESVGDMYDGKSDGPMLRPRKACNCTKSQCLKLYCDCFANGEFCNQCNCNNCHNNLENEELRQKAIRACLERNPNAFRPKIGKATVRSGGPEIIRRHNKGCNCKRSGCLKNYCECYEAKIACTMMCKCVGCRNIEETLERRRDAVRIRDKLADTAYRPPISTEHESAPRQPCSFLTPEVIEAVAQCMLATVSAPGEGEGEEQDLERSDTADPVEDILLEFSRCMADIISASHRQL